jgi:hypothetical protein
VLSIELALGLAILRPPKRLGKMAAQIIVVCGIALGLLRGMLDPAARFGTAFIGAQWTVTRKVAIGFVATIVAIFLVLQPAKRSYREQVWGHSIRTGEELGLGSRVSAWESSIAGRFFSEEPAPNDDSVVNRLSELEPVLHTIDMVPYRIDYAYGQSLMQILYAPIPRIIWPDKPTSNEEVAQHYAVIFGRQTERASETTAIGMTLLIEGYWNFGWIGVGLACVAMGLVVGAYQRVFTADHWALSTIGVAQLADLHSITPIVLLGSSMFQLVVGRLAAVWLIHWLANVMSSKVRRQGVPARPAAGRRAIAP